MTSFFGELRRRNVVKVAVAYAIVGWLLIEVASVLLPTFQAPEWVMRVFSFFIIAGFPVALVLSWAYELTPEGIKTAADVQSGDSVAPATGQKLNYLIISALVLALGFMVADQYTLDDDDTILPNSVAVLPCDDLSPNPENAYFAPGIHEEILNQLVKIRGLNVIAKTSVLQYASAARPITEIARELNVGSVMSCSVSYAEERVSIAAQLIDAETGVHLWSERYNREFADVFGIQADIARRIASALKVQLLASELVNIQEAPTESADAYALYLHALTLWQSTNPGLGGVENSTIQGLLDRAIALDPNFALAYALKARPYSVVSAYFCEPQDEAERARLARINVEQALALDPNLGQVQAAFGTIEANADRVSQATQAFERALQLNSNDPEILISAADFYSTVGEHEEALRLAHRAVELDPSSVGLTNSLGSMYGQAEMHEISIEWHRKAMLLDPGYAFAPFDMSRGYTALGNHAQAVEAARTAEELFRPECHIDPGILALIGYTYARAGYQEDAERLVERARRMDDISAWATAVAHLALGETDLALQALRMAEGPASPNQPGLNLIVNNTLNDPALELAEFVEERSRLEYSE